MSSKSHSTKWEYYDITNELYYDILSRKHHDVRYKVEILDHNENALDSIETAVDGNDGGSINNNNDQGTRRSCSLTLINVDKKYTLNENNFFWFNRKFRLYKGITDGDNTFWFTKGVYITQSADMDSTNKTVTIQGVDKYAQLDGTLNVLQADQFETIFEVGSTIERVVRDILMLDIGNGRPLDPIEPIIDTDIGKQKIYKEYTMSAGNYYGDFLNELMTAFGCDIYYDNYGRLNVKRVFNDDVAYWYAFKGSVYDFDYNSVNYQNPHMSGQLNGINKLTVETDNTWTKNASYTAVNNNPRSPLCYDKIGARTYAENGGIIYISSGDEEIDTPLTKCKEYAEYYLMKETMFDLSIEFNCPCLPHLNEGDVISITDEDLDLDRDYFLIASITQPLGAGEMSISAVNLKFLPTDISNDAIASTMINAGKLTNIKVEYDLNGGTGVTPNAQSVNFYGSFTPDFAINASEAYQKEGKEFVGWNTSSKSTTAKYISSKETYSCPTEDTTLYAVYEDTEDCQFKVIVDDASKISSSSVGTIPSFNSPTLEYVMMNNVKKYIVQVNQENPETITPPIMNIPKSGELTYIHGTSKSNWQKLNLPNMITEINYYILNLTQNTDAYIKLVFPKALPMDEIDINFLTGTRINELTLPQTQLKFIYNGSYTNTMLYNISGLSNLVFDYDVELFRYNAITSCGDLKSVTFNKQLIAKNDNPSCNIVGNNSTLESVCFKGETVFGNGYYVYDNTNLKSVTFEKPLTIDERFNLYSYVCYCRSINLESPIENFVVNDISTSGKVYLFMNIAFNCSVEFKNLALRANKDSADYPLTYAQCLSGNTFIGNEPIAFNDITVDGGVLFAGCTFSSGNGEILFKGNVDLKTLNGVNYFVSNTGLKTVRFYKSVNLGTTSFCGNSDLTDAYFYDDNISYHTSVFRSVNSNFKIHGVVADGNAKAMADMLGVPFELIEVVN